jgi:lipopolysaccharide export system permease protein
MLPGRLSRYILGQLTGGVLLALVIILAMTVLVDFVELTRTIGTRSSVSALELIVLALMRAPSFVEVTLPFIFLFGVMWAMFRLNRRNELVVLRASGMSAWRFMGPGVGLALVVGVLATTVLNPLAARLSGEFERRRAEILAPTSNVVGISEEGVWLREARPEGQVVIHAERAEVGGRRLIAPTLFFYATLGNAAPTFVRRIDAREGVLVADFWQLSDAWETAPARTDETTPDPAVFHPSIAIQTTVAAERLLETMGSPETLSFWNIPNQVQLLRDAGFAAAAYELHWHQLLATPLSLIAMTVVATAASLRQARRGGFFLLAATGASVGFLLFFAESFLAAFGNTGAMPIALAAWAAPTLTLLGGLLVISTVEDG